MCINHDYKMLESLRKYHYLHKVQISGKSFLYEISFYSKDMYIQYILYIYPVLCYIDSAAYLDYDCAVLCMIDN